jgi:hypothetical protein
MEFCYKQFEYKLIFLWNVKPQGMGHSKNKRLGQGGN